MKFWRRDYVEHFFCNPQSETIFNGNYCYSRFGRRRTLWYASRETLNVKSRLHGCVFSRTRRNVVPFSCGLREAVSRGNYSFHGETHCLRFLCIFFRQRYVLVSPLVLYRHRNSVVGDSWEIKFSLKYASIYHFQVVLYSHYFIQ